MRALRCRREDGYLKGVVDEERREDGGGLWVREGILLLSEHWVGTGGTVIIFFCILTPVWSLFWVYQHCVVRIQGLRVLFRETGEGGGYY